MTTPAGYEEEVLLLEARKNVYLWLAKVFLGEFKELIDASRSAPRAIDGEEDVTRLVRLMQETDLWGLHLQYDNLFVAPGPYYVPPFEYHYRTPPAEEGEKGDVEQYYAATGFTFPSERMVRHDHIGCELAFMSFLITGELQAIDKRNGEFARQIHGMQREFVSRHLGEWTSSLKKQVALKMRRGFMLEAVRYMHKFVHFDRSQLL